jgi:hypothetical protein
LQLQMAFRDLHTHLDGAQHKGLVAQCAGQGRQPSVSVVPMSRSKRSG